MTLLLLVGFMLTLTTIKDHSSNEWKKYKGSCISYKLKRDRLGYRKILFKSECEEKVKVNIKLRYNITGRIYKFRGVFKQNEIRTFKINPYKTQLNDQETGSGYETYMHHYYVHEFDIKIQNIEVHPPASASVPLVTSKVILN